MMVDHRRSKRLLLSIPVQVYGRTPNDQPFHDTTETKSVSANGGLLPLSPQVKRGQTLLLVNRFTQEERECRVVYVDSKDPGTESSVAVEFADPCGDFWHVYGPAVNLKPAMHTR